MSRARQPESRDSQADRIGWLDQPTGVRAAGATGGEDAEGTTDQEAAWHGAGHQETPTTQGVMRLFLVSFTV